MTDHRVLDAPSWSWISARGPLSFLRPVDTHLANIEVLDTQVSQPSNGIRGSITLFGGPLVPLRFYGSRRKLYLDPGGVRKICPHLVEHGTRERTNHLYRTPLQWFPDAEDRFHTGIALFMGGYGLVLRPMDETTKTFKRLGLCVWQDTSRHLAPSFLPGEAAKTRIAYTPV